MHYIEQTQRKTCEHYEVSFTAAPPWVNSGVAIGTESKRPIHGLRHPLTSDTTGWYIWCGDFSETDEFFKPMHTAHLEEALPDVLPYLGLPPGFRFLIDDNHHDVWFDQTLLNA